MKIGAQLYTVREYCKDLESFDQTLKKIAEIGFRYVQVSGVCDYEPAWLDAEMKKYGLTPVITHTNAQRMAEDPEAVCEDHKVFGVDYIGLGGCPSIWDMSVPDMDVADNFLKNYKHAMEVFRANGKKLMYHNHHFEFITLPNGKNMIEYFLENTDPEDLGFTLDTYWVQYGGHNPVDVIKMLKGRVACVHFKDYKVVRNREDAIHMAPVGDGTLDWDKIIPACEEAGAKYVLIEQDRCYDENPFDCLQKSFNFLVGKGLEVE